MAIDAQQLSLFDYAALDADIQISLRQRAERIRAYTKRYVLEVGKELVEARNELRHNKSGGFEGWVTLEFGWSRRTAYNFISVYESFGNCANFAQLEIADSALYLLAPASEVARNDAIERAEAGEKITYNIARDIIDAHKPLQPSSSPVIREYAEAPLTSAEIQDLEPQPGPIYGHVYPSPAPASYVPPIPYTPPTRTYDTIPTTPYAQDEEEIDELLDEVEPEVPQEPISLPCTQEMPVPQRSVPAALLMSESNEWYTPAVYVEAARELMGDIDLDPASNELANEVIQADTYYDIETNGLDKDWAGRIWLNPPYGITDGKSNQEVWAHRLMKQYGDKITTEAILLVNANTEAKWFQPLYNYPICFTDHRIRFYNTEGASSQPTQGNAFVYFGEQEARFIELFKQFGPIVRRIG